MEKHCLICIEKGGCHVERNLAFNRFIFEI